MTDKAEVTKFDVEARCPHCDEDSSVYEDEYKAGYVTCQHCDEEFEV
ncbi:hypothetical protein HG263_06725 [Pseudoalteromonas sp. JBTF-M23]|uniref:Uncharacterized protein n=1 Tax=Pseudoalteromonas caenipelagi TaxID=2726988 RepID=A0A849VAD4_9GAMM|nr:MULTISPECIES: hypothetical protein [Pseudoalteromonas]NOU50236.1 hypothetical protein [Pseudoalteromonas caenipelagi]